MRTAVEEVHGGDSVEQRSHGLVFVVRVGRLVAVLAEAELRMDLGMADRKPVVELEIAFAQLVQGMLTVGKNLED